MRKRTLLIVVPLCVVALVAGVAVAAPGEEQVSDAKLDKLHAVRPTAASPAPTAHADDAALNDAVRFVQGVQLDEAVAFVKSVQLAEVTAYVESVQGQEIAAFVEAATVSRSAPRVSSSGGDALSCIKWRESRGDYTVHNSHGSGASGAYQFMPGTWNSIAASSGRADLVGLDPAAAAPADQDAMAAALYAQQGSAPWGGAC